RTDQNRVRAAELREQANAQATGVQQREAAARETEAKAAQARAEADRKAAEAERLEAEARDRETTAAGYREHREDSLRRADELDPDVDHKHRANGTTEAEADAEASTTGGHRATTEGDGVSPGEHHTTPADPDSTTRAADVEQGHGTHRA
ncbi:MAG: hypothetical protein ACRDQD_14195, partial [Nocardioidaceae bacterium]